MDHLFSKLIALGELIRLDKPYGTLLLLWPSLWALAMASRGWPMPELIMLFTLGAFVMRSAGCAMNDLADRHIDAKVARTKTRPLPSGRLTPREALIAIGLLLALAALIVWQLPPQTRWLALPAVALAAAYPFAKRLFPAPQLILGAAFGWGVPMAWTAVRSGIDLTVWLLFLATVCWAIAYDTIYALMDLPDDERLRIHSTARLFGPLAGPAIGAFGLAMLLLLVLAGRRSGLGWLYFGALLLVGLLFLYQAVRVRMGVDRDTAFHLFRAHVWVGLIILIGIELDYAIGRMMIR